MLPSLLDPVTWLAWPLSADWLYDKILRWDTLSLIYKRHDCCVFNHTVLNISILFLRPVSIFRVFFLDSGEILEFWLAAVNQDIGSWSKGSCCSGHTWFVANLLRKVTGGIFVLCLFGEYCRVQHKQLNSETEQERHRNFAFECLVVFGFVSGPQIWQSIIKIRAGTTTLLYLVMYAGVSEQIVGHSFVFQSFCYVWTLF